MGAMPTVDGSPLCVPCARVLEDVRERWGMESGWCERGQHYVTALDPQWGREAIPLDQYVVATHTIQLLYFRECVGEVGRMVSKAGETSANFTSAAIFRRLAL